MATQGLNGYNQTISGTIETIFDQPTDFPNRNVYGMRFSAPSGNTGNVTLQIIGIHQYGNADAFDAQNQVVLRPGDVKEFFTSGRSNSGGITNVQALSDNGTETLDWDATVT